MGGGRQVHDPPEKCAVVIGGHFAEERVGVPANASSIASQSLAERCFSASGITSFSSARMCDQWNVA
jgi:hypothetical protein